MGAPRILDPKGGEEEEGYVGALRLPTIKMPFHP